MLPTIQYVTKHLGDQMPLIREIILSAWARLDLVPAAERVALTSTTRANMVQNWIVEEASRRLNYRQIVDCSGMKVFVMGGGIALRFKKLDRDGLSRNVKTGQITKFAAQEQLAGVESQCNIEAGYVLDALQTHIESTHIVCPNGIRNICWSLELTDARPKAVVRDLFQTRNAPGENVLPFKKKKEFGDHEKKENKGDGSGA